MAAPTNGFATLKSTDPGAETIQAIADLVKLDHASVEFRELPRGAIGKGPKVDQAYVAILRDDKGVRIESIAGHIETARGKPLRRTGTAMALTLDSFSELVNRHKSESESVVFANPDWREPSITAVLDYHTQQNEQMGRSGETQEDPGARFGKHRIHYAYPLSDAWKAWVSANGKKMAQADFAAFLEDHITELASPTPAECIQFERDFKSKFATPAELIDLSRGLEVMVGARVKNKVRLDTGETQMVFEVEHRDMEGNSLTVPGLFLLSVAPFHRGDAIRIPCRLRYRAGGGDLIWFYEMIQPDRFIDERLQEDLAEVGSETGLLCINGSPEMPA